VRLRLELKLLIDQHVGGHSQEIDRRGMANIVEPMGAVKVVVHAMQLPVVVRRGASRDLVARRLMRLHVIGAGARVAKVFSTDLTSKRPAFRVNANVLYHVGL